MSEVSSIRVEAGTYEWGAQTLSRITVGALPAGGEYFTLASGANDPTQVDYYAWFQIDAAGADPAPAGRTGIEIDLLSSDSLSAAATKIAAALTAEGDFNAVVDPNDSTSVILQNVHTGTSDSVADVDTGFTFAELLAGSSLDLGLINGDTEISLSEDLLDITAQQFGTAIQERIRTGKNIEGVAISMKEITAARIKAILEAGGTSITPAGGTEVTGWGSSKDFNGVFANSRKLIIHPKRLVSTDLSEDLTFWRAYPQIDSLNFSGESEQLLTVTFGILPDCFIRDEVRHFVRGDHTQNFLAS